MRGTVGIGAIQNSHSLSVFASFSNLLCRERTEDARTNNTDLFALIAQLAGLETSIACARAQNNDDEISVFGTPHAPLALEVRSAFHANGVDALVNDYVVGLGGADITLEQMNTVFSDLEARAAGEGDGSIKYLGIEE